MLVNYSIIPLSKKASANSIPELEVEESDVVGCGHGTANGPVDESQRFYLMARVSRARIGRCPHRHSSIPPSLKWWKCSLMVDISR